MTDERNTSSEGRRQRGRLEIRAGQPLAFVEDTQIGDGAKDLPEELRLAATRVGATLKLYRDAATSLLSTHQNVMGIPSQMV
jgi:hypothetical protein